ncbi:hypothetical protein RRG08_055657 [Elysia crispata]|uniref:Uncharacterized protein n=1 Tax=Elysia crispata TaxID=231223 RepID=A0AAE1DBM0_9GAST|nr:hypothetical protein RRG08_055657 [Elysia crispata]
MPTEPYVRCQQTTIDWYYSGSRCEKRFRLVTHIAASVSPGTLGQANLDGQTQLSTLGCLTADTSLSRAEARVVCNGCLHFFADYQEFWIYPAQDTFLCPRSAYETIKLRFKATLAESRPRTWLLATKEAIEPPYCLQRLVLYCSTEDSYVGLEIATKTL